MNDDAKIAIVGMAGRFPGADSIANLWFDVVRPAREAITRYQTDGATIGYGVLNQPAMFDHELFDMSPGEAIRIAPQDRVFLEACWHALESAGIDISRASGRTCIYASGSINPLSYLKRLVEAADKDALAGAFDLMLANAPDTLATRVAYKLGTRGEALTVQTHCSSSLVAVHLAAQSLMSGISDLAIAGGVSVRFSVAVDQEAELNKLGGRNEGFILSPNGECRALLDGAQGALNGDGVGVVVLKRFEDAMADGDEIFATILATSINNDGQNKIGFTAPSIDGVTGVIEDSLAFAQVNPSDVGFIECHGTGTSLGDAIELRSLRKVFDAPDRATPLYLGSIKSNIGHLAAAAGVTGLIKAALALYYRELPPLAHANEERPHEEIENSPVLKVSAEPIAWASSDEKRRIAGVTSLGIGGTNVYALLEEPPKHTSTPDNRDCQVLVWSGRSAREADDLGRRLGSTFRVRGESLSLSDTAHTMRTGRRLFDHRRFLVAKNAQDAMQDLEDGRWVTPPEWDSATSQVAFMFPGNGAAKPGMGSVHLKRDPKLRGRIDEAAEVAREFSDFPILRYLTESDFGAVTFDQEFLAVVVFEWALAKRMMAFGVRPDALIGLSLGEYTALALSGALSLRDTLRLVELRGRLIERIRGGAILLVSQPVADLRIPLALDFAIQPSPEHTVLVGEPADIQAYEKVLIADGTSCRRIDVDFPVHSRAMDSIENDLKEAIGDLRFGEPQIPVVGNFTGDFLKAGMPAADYLFNQMRHTVRFAESLERLRGQGVGLFAEVGPDVGLSRYCSWNFKSDPLIAISTTAAHTHSAHDDWHEVSATVGLAWALGRDIDWAEFGATGHATQLPNTQLRRRYFYLGELSPESQEWESKTARQHASDREMPRNYLEVEIAKIWGSILGVEDIAIDENFFDLGGDSLQATRVLGSLQSELAPDLSIEDLLQYRTIREVASFIESSDSRHDDDAAPAAADSSGYYCVFEMDFGGVMSTIYFTKDEFDANGIPDNAQNVRIFGD